MTLGMLSSHRLLFRMLLILYLDIIVLLTLFVELTDSNAIARYNRSYFDKLTRQ